MKNNPFCGSCKSKPLFMDSFFLGETKGLLPKSVVNTFNFYQILREILINTKITSPKVQLISNDTA